MESLNLPFKVRKYRDTYRIVSKKDLYKFASSHSHEDLDEVRVFVPETKNYKKLSSTNKKIRVVYEKLINEIKNFIDSIQERRREREASKKLLLIRYDGDNDEVKRLTNAFNKQNTARIALTKRRIIPNLTFTTPIIEDLHNSNLNREKLEKIFSLLVKYDKEHDPTEEIDIAQKSKTKKNPSLQSDYRNFPFIRYVIDCQNAIYITEGDGVEDHEFISSLCDASTMIIIGLSTLKLKLLNEISKERKIHPQITPYYLLNFKLLDGAGKFINSSQIKDGGAFAGLDRNRKIDGGSSRISLNLKSNSTNILLSSIQSLENGYNDDRSPIALWGFKIVNYTESPEERNLLRGETLTAYAPQPNKYYLQTYTNKTLYLHEFEETKNMCLFESLFYYVCPRETIEKFSNCKKSKVGWKNEILRTLSSDFPKLIPIIKMENNLHPFFNTLISEYREKVIGKNFIVFDWHSGECIHFCNDVNAVENCYFIYRNNHIAPTSIDRINLAKNNREVLKNKKERGDSTMIDILKIKGMEDFSYFKRQKIGSTTKDIPDLLVHKLTEEIVTDKKITKEEREIKACDYLDSLYPSERDELFNKYLTKAPSHFLFVDIESSKKSSYDESNGVTTNKQIPIDIEVFEYKGRDFFESKDCNSLISKCNIHSFTDESCVSKFVDFLLSFKSDDHLKTRFRKLHKNDKHHHETNEVKVYFHNGSRYDTALIFRELKMKYENTELIGDATHLKIVKCGNISIEDFCLICPGSLDSLSKAYLGKKIGKSDFNIHLLTQDGWKNHIEECKKYCRRDVELLTCIHFNFFRGIFDIPSSVLNEKTVELSSLKDKYGDNLPNHEIEVKDGVTYAKISNNIKVGHILSDKLFAPTAASLANRIFMKCFNSTQLYNQPTEMVNLARCSYYGGETRLFRSITKTRGKFIVMLDVASMYPSVMRDEMIGVNFSHYNGFEEVKTFTKEDIPSIRMNRIYTITSFEFSSKSKIRTLPVKTPSGNFNPYRKVDPEGMSYAGPDILTALENDCVIKCNGYSEYTPAPLYFQFIGRLYPIRLIAKKEKNDGVSNSIKLTMNSTYGKKAQNITTKTTVLNKNQLSDFLREDNHIISVSSFGDDYLSSDISNSDLVNVITSNIDEKSIGQCVHIASFITSFARRKLYKMMEKIGIEHILYCDTDSLLVDLSVEELNSKEIYSSKELGGWDFEYSRIIPESYIGISPKIYAFKYLIPKDEFVKNLIQQGDENSVDKVLESCEIVDVDGNEFIVQEKLRIKGVSQTKTVFEKNGDTYEKKSEKVVKYEHYLKILKDGHYTFTGLTQFKVKRGGVDVLENISKVIRFKNTKTKVLSSGESVDFYDEEEREEYIRNL